VVAAEIGDDGRVGPPTALDGLAEPGDVVRLQSILTDGRLVVVVGTAPSRAWAWTPGEDPIRIRLPDGLRLDVELVPWPRGISWLEPGEGVVLAEVSELGEVRPVATLASGAGRWDPTGEVVAQVEATVPVVSSPFAGGFAATRLPLPRPEDRSWEVVGWESSDTVVVAVPTPGDLRARTLVRCAVPDLVCERVATTAQGRVLLPE
jgi:hypothetical protein